VSQQSVLFYRVEREAHAGGLALTGRLFGAEWTLYGERGWRSDDHVTDRRLDAPTDRWRADGWTWGLALQRSFLGDRLLATVQARLATLRGNATRADLTGDVFRSSERMLDLWGDVRYASGDSVWQIAAVGSLRREHRVRSDFIVPIGTDVLALTPAGGLEIARAFGRTAVSVGYGVGLYSAASTLPDPTAMGEVYRRVLAAEQEYYARRALLFSGSLTIRQRVGSHTALLLQAHGSRIRPSGPAPVLTLGASGHRLLADVALGLVMVR
jgi:hypothetical protein